MDEHEVASFIGRRARQPSIVLRVPGRVGMQSGGAEYNLRNRPRQSAGKWIITLNQRNTQKD
jgi:hypothetical protein